MPSPRHAIATDNPALDHICCQVSPNSKQMCVLARGHEGPCGWVHWMDLPVKEGLVLESPDA